MSRKKRRIKSQPLTITQLEDRNLLAADFTVPLALDFVHQSAFHDVQQTTLSVTEVRNIDGTGNNLSDPELGSTHEALLRGASTEYEDGISTPTGSDRPSAREISNVVATQTTTETNDRGLTDLIWVFGQFIDHDLDLSEGGTETEDFSIEVPTGDIFFDPFSTGEATIALSRSPSDPDSGTSIDNPLEQINDITAFLDGSVVYGSDEVRAAELRTFEGGLLKTSAGDLLPFNEAGLDNAGGDGDTLFLAGDVRANENIALTAMHTVWVREHNFWASEISQKNPELSDEAVYQQAKAIVTAELQAITYNEFLPALLGTDAISAYSGYDDTVDPGINNEFSTAAYRFGHSMLSTELLRLNDDGTVADEGNISLQDAFFSPDEIVENGIDSILAGAASQIANEIDNQVVDDIRNFLFGPPGAGGFDLASLNIQRGRDHGLADYNQAREDFGLERVESFSDITSDPEVADKLQQLYGTVDNIDLWVGGLAEDHVEGSSMGELFSTIIVDQFERIRDGDRFWYEEIFSGHQLQSINQTTLADVIHRNTEITGLSDTSFFAEGFEPTEDEHNHDRRNRHHRADFARQHQGHQRRGQEPVGHQRQMRGNHSDVSDRGNLRGSQAQQQGHRDNQNDNQRDNQRSTKQSLRSLDALFAKVNFRVR